MDLLTPPLKDFSLGDRQLWIAALPMVPGGNAANFAFGTAGLDLKAGLAACLGDDPASRFLKAQMRRMKVTSFVKFRRGVEAGRTIALAHANGSRQLLTYNGSNLAFSPRDIPDRALDAKHVHRAGYWWTPKLQGAPSRLILRKARDRGAETSLDVATDPEGWTDRRRAQVLEVLPETTIFFGNEEEVRGVLGGRDIAASAVEARALGVEILAVHRGGRGCTVASREGVVRVPAFRVQPKNPTGTGDLFNSGFVFGRLRGWPIERCARFANAVAARHLEGASAYPRPREVERRFALG